MALSFVETRAIGNKKVYIVRNHHEVFVPWADYASRHEVAPVLLTFDHHADTRTAFFRHAMDIAGENWKTVSERLMKDLDYHQQESTKAALEKLRNNEHIDLALKKGILSDAVVFSMLDIGVCKDYSNERICYIDPDCSSSCCKAVHDDKCRLELYDKVIETSELQFKLKQVNRFVPGFYSQQGISRKYILDIDLDCFHTRKAIEPDDINLFHELVANAEIITIATEPDYVEMEKVDASIHSDWLLERLLAHVKRALEGKVIADELTQ